MEFVLPVLYNQYFICASQETCFVPPGVSPLWNLLSDFMRCQMCILNGSIALALNDDILSSSPTFNVADIDKVRIYCYMFEISHLWTSATSTIIQRFNLLPEMNSGNSIYALCSTLHFWDTFWQEHSKEQMEYLKTIAGIPVTLNESMYTSKQKCREHRQVTMFLPCTKAVMSTADFWNGISRSE